MITLAYFFWVFVFTGLLIGLLPYRFYRIEFASIVIIVGFLLGSWLALLLSIPLPYKASLPVGIALCMVGSRALYGIRTKSHCTWQSDEPFKSRDWIVLTVLTSLGLGYLFWTHMAMLRSDGGLWSGGASWSDLGMHISLISYQSQQSHFDTIFPLVYQGQLVYHFLIDFLSSLFLRDGFTLGESLDFPAIPLALAFVQLAFFTSYRLFKRTDAAALTIYLFLLGGTTYGTFLFVRDMGRAHDAAWSLFRHLQPEYTTIWEDNAVFSNFITCALLPQRPVLFGFGILTFLIDLVVMNEETPSHRGPLLLGFLVGTLPLAHVHGWLMCMFLLTVLLVREWVVRRRPGPWLWAWLLSLLPATPQLLYLMHAAYHSGYGYFKVGWHMGSINGSETLLGFWFRQLGPALIMMAVCADVCLHRWKNTMLPVLYFPFLVVFVAANVYIMQPSDYDNIKLFHMVYFMIALLSAPLLLETMVMPGWRKLICPLVVLLWIAPGILSIWRELNVSDWSLANQDERNFGRLIQEHTPPTALFMVPGDQHQPVSFLAGRHIVLGWNGWLESYGIDYKPIEDDEKKVFAGSPDALDILHKYHADFLVLDKLRDDEWKCNVDYYHAHLDQYHVNYEDDRWLVLKVPPPQP